MGYVKAVDGVSFRLQPGETLGIVGESGCGKSTLARTIMRVLEPTAGKILLDGQDISQLSGKALRRIRRKFQMVFQDPYASLNPRMSVQDIIAEPLVVNGLVAARDIPAVVADLLEKVGLKADDRQRYPHEFSGGSGSVLALRAPSRCSHG
ncbi:hypothetical protein GCM10025857_17270 [Alicyclobacillus contaminans]|nr:hypothetical protein GCM10025857_17270 [Alicyclobacillus contaminans]